MPSTYSVNFTLVIENHTRFLLHNPQTYIKSGHISTAPSDVIPGFWDAMAGHKARDTATGCSGTVSWMIGQTDYMLVVMYSIPFSFDLHSNWLAIGIFPQGSNISRLLYTPPFFDRMYYNSGLRFRRKEFYHDAEAVEYKDANFHAIAMMGTLHKPMIKVRLLPILEANLAPPLKQFYEENGWEFDRHYLDIWGLWDCCTY